MVITWIEPGSRIRHSKQKNLTGIVADAPIIKGRVLVRWDDGTVGRYYPSSLEPEGAEDEDHKGMVRGYDGEWKWL